MWPSFINSLFEYVPPCERDPWHDDPRDVKPGSDTSYNPGHAWNQFVERTKSEDIVSMTQCTKCGIFFVSVDGQTTCYNCRETS